MDTTKSRETSRLNPKSVFLIKKNVYVYNKKWSK